MMDTAPDYASLADSKRTAAAMIRQIARTLPLVADRTLLISHASWLEAEAISLDGKSTAAEAEH
jgi:hypothetical protein